MSRKTVMGLRRGDIITCSSCRNEIMKMKADGRDIFLEVCKILTSKHLEKRHFPWTKLFQFRDGWEKYKKDIALNLPIKCLNCGGVAMHTQPRFGVHTRYGWVEGFDVDWDDPRPKLGNIEREYIKEEVSAGRMREK